jgi:DNA-binding NtrC family response regulator
MCQEVRVLVIEDEPAVRAPYREALAEGGYHVEQTEDLSEALHRLAEDYFDAVIVDSSVPEAADLELLKQIRHENPSLAVIVASGCALRRPMKEYIEIGIDDFAIMPLLADGLRFVVDFALEKMRLRHKATHQAGLTLDGGDFFY